MLNRIKEWAGVVALVIAIVAFGSVGSHKSLGGITNYDAIELTNGLLVSGSTTQLSTLKVGSSGTGLTNAIVTTCAAKADTSITATTTGLIQCTGVTGLTSSDKVVAQFATSSPSGWVLGADAFNVVATKASTTAGALDIFVANWTGKNAAPSAVGQVASTVALFISH